MTVSSPVRIAMNVKPEVQHPPTDLLSGEVLGSTPLGIGPELQMRPVEGPGGGGGDREPRPRPRPGGGSGSGSGSRPSPGPKPQTGPGGDSFVSRRITAQATMAVTDDENFAANEHGTASMTREAIISGNSPQPFMHMQRGVGGEVRVELDLSAQALGNGRVRVLADAKLFEGTSEQTDDLDGQRSQELEVPVDGFAALHIDIKNDNEDGDHAEIDVNFSNQSA